MTRVSVPFGARMGFIGESGQHAGSALSVALGGAAMWMYVGPVIPTVLIAPGNGDLVRSSLLDTSFHERLGGVVPCGL